MPINLKTCTESERQAEYTRIATEFGDDQFFTKKELNHLPNILMNGEMVLAFSSGLMDGNTWLITLTDKRIIFLDKGFLYGLKQTTIDLDKVNAISGDTGFFFGTIAIQDGANIREIKNVWKNTVVKFTSKVQEAIENRKQSHLAPANPAEGDVISKLERLSVLLEKGVLSNDEFAAQKAKLLNS